MCPAKPQRPDRHQDRNHDLTYVRPGTVQERHQASDDGDRAQSERPEHVDPARVAGCQLHLPCDRHNSRQHGTHRCCEDNEVKHVHPRSSVRAWGPGNNHSCAVGRDALNAGLTINMAASHPDEWLHQTTDQTVQPKITLHRDQADAIFARIDQHLMIHGFVA